VQYARLYAVVTSLSNKAIKLEKEETSKLLASGAVRFLKVL